MARTTNKSQTKKASKSQKIQQKALSGGGAEMDEYLFEDVEDSDSLAASANIVTRRKIELYWEKKRLMREIGGIESLDDLGF